LYLDSYKLVKLRAVMAVLVGGAAVAGLCYEANGAVLDIIEIRLDLYSRYVAPLVEELLKGLIVIALIRSHRIGFLVDAAIFRPLPSAPDSPWWKTCIFLRLIPEAGLGIWIVRGFGTAIMHGGATATFAVLGLATLERGKRTGIAALIPGYVLAVLRALRLQPTVELAARGDPWSCWWCCRRSCTWCSSAAKRRSVTGSQRL